MDVLRVIRKLQFTSGEWFRFLLVAMLIVMIASPLKGQTASADQTDPRLDELFRELRTGGTANVEANVSRINELWSMSQSDTINLLYERALVLYNKGEHDKALRLLTYVQALSPNFMQAHALSGFTRLSIDDRAGALRDFGKALELEPRQFEVRKALASLLLANDAKREAFDMVQKALEWNPHDENLIRMARNLRTELAGQEI